MIPLLPAEILLSGRLDAGLPGVIPGAVLSRMGLDVFLIHLRDISQKVAAGIDGIVPYAPDLPPESRKIVLDLGKLHVSLRLDLLEHHHALVAYLLSVPGIFGHLFPDELRSGLKD